MNKSKVYFTNLRTNSNMTLLQKLDRLVKKAGIENIDFNEFVLKIYLYNVMYHNVFMCYTIWNYLFYRVSINKNFGDYYNKILDKTIISLEFPFIRL